MSDYLVVLMTAATLAEAESIAQELVNQRLAACVNIVPQILSVYCWKGEVCRDNEVLMIAKTDRAHYASLEQAVKHGHSYEVPEVIAISIIEGSESYLGWLAQSLSNGEDDG